MSDWREYGATRELRRKKRKLKEHILKNEQSYLCGYCESKVNLTSSHLEHIKPKSLDKINLTFNYINILVSCNGTCHNQIDDNTSYHCGHRKDKNDTEYNDALFLNPVQVSDIRDYFQYDLDDFNIYPSDKDEEKAAYMITTLHLNNEGLPKAREIAQRNFQNKLRQISDVEIRKQEIKAILSRGNIEQVSFLVYTYKDLLGL